MITNLKDSPHLFEKTLKLIEESFKYETPNTFLEDFAPLLSKDNLQNCFVIVDANQEVIAHVGAKSREIVIEGNSFNITMLGGIAVSSENRGSGLFNKLFTRVIETKKDESSFFVLWSDLEKLYNKFGFYLCGAQFENTNGTLSNTSFTKSKLEKLSDSEKEDLRGLYNNSFCKSYLSLQRETKDWAEIESIKSADLFFRKDNNKIVEYFLTNKGQDLSGIIYEYGTSREIVPFLTEIASYGLLWTGDNFLESENAQYQFFLSPGNEELFNQFIKAYTNSKFTIRAFNFEKNEVFVDYEEETLSFEIDDFLKGVFGPENFEEIETRPIFISGLDSI